MDLPGNRLKKIRKDKGMSQAQLASLIGVSQTFLSDLEHNNSAMTEVLLNSLEYKTGVNKEWIKTGRGGKFLYLNLNGAEGAVSEPEFDADLQSIARALQKMPAKHRSEVTKKVLSFIGLLLNLLKKK